MMENAAIYVRVSTSKQEVENQIADCVKFAEQHNFKYEVFKEPARSAYKEIDRPVLNSILARARKGEFKHIVVWDYDRLYRNRKKFVEVMQAYSKLGVKIHSHRQEWVEEIHKVPSPWNEILYDMIIQVIGWIGEEESIKRAERTRAALSRIQNRLEKQGVYVARNGRQIVQLGRPKIMLDPTDVLEMRKNGLSIREIARKLKVSKSKVARIISGG